MSLIIYDIVFLIAFAVFVSVFLYTRKHNLKREGLLFLYKTQWGIKLINAVGNKSPKAFKIFSYISVTIGYVLMISMFYLLGRIVYLYIAFPSVVREIKVPPITPLIPYLPQIFKLDFLPPFYFTYWILIIAIIAITHEFAHGIFAANNKVKINSTGFGFFPFFLPIFLAAFVELDEKEMPKKGIFGQLAILSAGTFANVLTAILFFGVLLLYFPLAFTPSGVVYDTYPYSIVNIQDISEMNGIQLDNPNYDEILNLTSDERFNNLIVGDFNYLATKKLLDEQKENTGRILLYYDAPAIRIDLESVILDIDGNPITSIDSLQKSLDTHSPGDKITLRVLSEDGKEIERELVLEEHPEDECRVWLGVGFSPEQSRSGLLGKVYDMLSSFKDNNVYYKESVKEVSWFFYNLLWWIVLISISVALVNMLPVGIFDGGRFFYLTILALTGKEKTARRAFAFSTYFILFVILVLMFFWATSFF
jgi:membrane-associated protease RseP (regulator of RpoE activity)